MNNISLEKMKNLYDRVLLLLQDVEVGQEYYINLLDQVQQVEKYVHDNKSHFKDEYEPLVELCNLLILHIKFKIDQVVKVDIVKPIYQ